MKRNRQTKKLSNHMRVGEYGGFLKICYLENDGKETNECLLLSSKEAKKLKAYLNDFDFTEIERIEKLREEEEE